MKSILYGEVREELSVKDIPSKVMKEVDKLYGRRVLKDDKES